MKKIAFMLLISFMLVGCSKANQKETDTTTPTDTTVDEPTASPTETPKPTEAVREEIIPADPFDSEGRALATFGTPNVDGTIDDIWQAAGTIVPEIISSPNVAATGEFKVLWDDNALYSLFIVTDPELNKASSNTYEQDSVEVFLDEMNDKASSYQSDDVHYRVNYDNEASTDAGDSKRFYTATTSLKDESGKVIGYIVEASLSWTNTPANDTVMGFDLQINDAGQTGSRLGTVNIFDRTGTAWSNPSSMGEIILRGKDIDSVTEASPYMLQAYIKHAEGFNPEGYVNSEILTTTIMEAKDILEKPGATQKDFDDVLEKLRDAVSKLDDGSGFPNVEQLAASETLPDPFTFFNGDSVNNAEDWKKRAKEISNLYQYYMYGVMPDPSGETVTYEANDNNLKITVEANGKKISYNAMFSVPDKSKVKMPEGGYPVIMAFGWLTQTAYANDNGYAVITLDTSQIAADNTSRTGVFYELYPYGDVWQKQTGTLMAWSWGFSKIIDALENGAGSELGISPNNTILTGVSRWGKATAVAGAFDKRIRITAPSCSGAGGMAAFRYKSEGKTYDYSSIGIATPHVMTANEPLSSLQSSGERQWFNDKFLQFKDVNTMPFDQHLLAALTAEEDRYMFITGSYLYEDWTNPPSMWLTYLAAREVFEFLGLDKNIAIHIHKEGHMVTDEDMVYLIDFANHHFYGKKVKSDLNDLTTTLYAEPANYDPIYDKYMK
ncbi:hypothetical protein I5677_01400 [Mobilitalea sibirica]|uniref:Carbohydrate-binding domain-containing protein n=1 Tax=Mobilitalea sibirica TaxID=1462919 RepID=A0A8J7H7M3_9FIRM|nr:sugar-binding protein [Mobilitalea sibirica]MBH1939545.1 hypothetical protein [Mobilitalea sibirica]